MVQYVHTLRCFELWRHGFWWQSTSASGEHTAFIFGVEDGVGMFVGIEPTRLYGVKPRMFATVKMSSNTEFISSFYCVYLRGVAHCAVYSTWPTAWRPSETRWIPCFASPVRVFCVATACVLRRHYLCFASPLPVICIATACVLRRHCPFLRRHCRCFVSPLPVFCVATARDRGRHCPADWVFVSWLYPWSWL
jgi:hypothetical protein